MIWKIITGITGLLTVLLVALVSYIFISGHIPFHPQPEQAPTTIDDVIVKPHEALKTFSETKSKFINDLIAALKTRQIEQDARQDQLDAREQEIILREQVIAEMNRKFAKLQADLEAQQVRLEKDIIDAGEQSRSNLQRIAEMVAKMEPESAVEVLQEMAPDRVAIILSMLDNRPAAKILDAATAGGRKGAATAAKWTEAMEQMEEEEPQDTGEFQ